MSRFLALRELCTYVDSVYDVQTDGEIARIAVAGERVWDGRQSLFNRRKSILRDEWAQQQLPWPDTLSSAP